jgi:hypothetical protein
VLAGLLNIPHTNEDWAQWSWNHKLSHDQIRAAILKQYSYSLTDFLIDPMDPKAMQQFLQNNSQLHGDMNATLQLPGTNLEDADLSNKNQLESWLNMHYMEHMSAEFKLGIGS